jgi:flagellin
VAAADSAADIAQSVTNNVSGISAEAVTQARVTMTTSAATPVGVVDVIVNEAAIAQVTAATNIETTAGLVVAAINGNESVANNITAIDNGDGSFDLIDASGADIRFELTASGAGETLSASIQALNAAGVAGGNAPTMNVAADNEVIITGSVLFTVDDTSKTYSAFASTSAGTTTATAAANGAGTAGGTTVAGSAVSAVNISTAAGATSALAVIDSALTTLDSQRATLGAVQNRFDSVISNLSNVAENTSAARSRIMDADFASETAQLARTQILQQAGISVLAQANAQPQNVLALLQ